jgi:hypothetical protein
MSRNLVFETQQYRVFDLSQEIEIIPSFSIDKAAFILELEQKVKLGQPDDEQEETLSKRLSDYLRTLLGRKDVDYLSMMSQGSSVVPLFQASQELTARELLGELDLFFTVLGEKGIQSHPALTIFAELYEGLSAMRRLSTYNEQQAFLRMFLSRFSKGYEQFLSRLGDDRGSTGSCTNAGKDNCSKDDASKSRDGKDDTPQQT